MNGSSCGTCRFVAAEPLGFLDFTVGTELALANGGTFDLVADQRRAEELLGRSFDDMIRHLSPPQDSAASSRFERRYQRVETEAGDRHGAAILDKVNARLVHDGIPPVGGGTALEAGGGHGRYLPGFRDAFDEVVFVDCSLVNLVLARQFAYERDLDGILFVRADVTALPFEDGTFDFVHQNGVIEHVNDPDKMVSESVRVLSSPAGVYACLSPNRFPITPEPHFQLPLFGLFPPRMRRWLIARTRGDTDERGTDPRSLRDVRAHMKGVGGADAVYFLPPRLPSIARRTPLRRAVKRALDITWVRRGVLSLVNGPLLGVMPYHIALVIRRI